LVGWLVGCQMALSSKVTEELRVSKDSLDDGELHSGAADVFTVLCSCSWFIV